MRLFEVRGLSRSRDKAFKGKKNNIVVYVKWLDTIQSWHYLMIHPNGKRYSSLWDEIRFKDFDECRKAAENYCDKTSKDDR